MSKPWRDDPELVREADENDLQRIELTPQWQRLFDTVEQIFAPGKESMAAGIQRAALKGFLWQAKRRVAIDPDATRAYVVESMQAVTACLEIEPRELYPDLTPKEPAAVA